MPGKLSRLCAGLDVYVGITTCSTFTQYFALRNVTRWNTILIILQVLLQSPGGHKPKHHYIHNVCDPKPKGDCCSIYLSMYCNYSIWSKDTGRVLFGYFSRGNPRNFTQSFLWSPPSFVCRDRHTSPFSKVDINVGARAQSFWIHSGWQVKRASTP